MTTPINIRSRQIYTYDIGEFLQMTTQDATLFLALYVADLGRRPLARIAHEVLGLNIYCHYENDNIEELVELACSVIGSDRNEILERCKKNPDPPLYSTSPMAIWTTVYCIAREQKHSIAMRIAFRKMMSFAIESEQNGLTAYKEMATILRQRLHVTPDGVD